MLKRDKFVTKGLLFFACAAVLANMQPGHSEPIQLRELVIDELPADAKESFRSVMINEALEARADIETARGMERQKEWAKAAGWYQDVLTKYRLRVIAWKADPQTKVINSYRGVVYQVQEALAKWPEEGIKAYRARYESAAVAMLESAAPDDFNGLQNIIDTYFLTESAKTAAMRLINLRMESGEYDAAARIGTLLLDWYPADHLINERARVLFRTSLALHLCGNANEATNRASELKIKYPDTVDSIFGKDSNLSNELAKLLENKNIANATLTLSADRWPMFSGSPDRSHLSDAKGYMGARLYSIDLPARPNLRDPATMNRAAIEAQEDRDSKSTGIMPVVDGQNMYFQDGLRIWAVDLGSGIPLPAWTQTYGNSGVYQLKAGVSLRSMQSTLTLTENTVLGVMGVPNRMQGQFAQLGLQMPDGTQMVCLDRHTGKELWKVAPASVGGDELKPEDKERLRKLDFSGSPVVVGDNVFVIARGGKDMQFENCYVLCFSLTDGKFRFATLLATANSANQNDFNGTGSTTSHLAYSSGRLYVLTNLGAVAAIDASNGSIVWLNLYANNTQQNNNANDFGGGFGGRRFRGNVTSNLPNLRPWELNPIFVNDGKLFFAPVDSKYLLIHNASDGRELKRINLEDIAPNNLNDRPNVVLGVHGSIVILSSSSRIYQIDWNKFDLNSSFEKNHENGAAGYSSTIGTTDNRIVGRPFATQDSVYVPTEQYLATISSDISSKIRAKYPSRGNWSEQNIAESRLGPGNIIVVREHVIVAKKDAIDVYTDLDLAKSRLDREIAAAPSDAMPRLHYAEIMFAANQLPLAREKMNDAIGLLGGLDHLTPGYARAHLFNDSLNFAKKLSETKTAEAMDGAFEFYDIAGKSAETPLEHVIYRFSRATFSRNTVSNDRYLNAVTLYQEVLSNPAWRQVGMQTDAIGASEARGNVLAGVEAETQIADIIRRNPTAYQKVKEQAEAAFEVAKVSKNVAQLKEVADSFPNSQQAFKAMELAASSFEDTGDFRQSTNLLRQMFRRLPEGVDKTSLIESLARNYLMLPGGMDIAIARLQKDKVMLFAKLQKPLSLPDGTKIQDVTFGEAAAQLLKLRPEDPGAKLADFKVPALIDKTDKTIFAKPNQLGFVADLTEITGLLQPTLEMRNFSRPDRTVALNNAKIKLLPATDAKELGTNLDFDEPVRSILWLTSTMGKKNTQDLLAWNSTQLGLLDGDAASTKWMIRLNDLPRANEVTVAGKRNIDPIADIVAAANDDPNMAFRQQQLIQMRGRNIRRLGGQMVNVAAQADQPNGPELISNLAPLSDRIVFSSSLGRMACVNSKDGKLIWQVKIGNVSIDRLVACEDFTAIKFLEETTSRIIVLDNLTGQIIMERSFAIAANLLPINMAISPDGVLVWTLPDRLCGKDLYEADPKKLTFENPRVDRTNENPNGSTNQITYAGCDKPGQLIIHDRKIIALKDRGSNIAVFNIDTGQLSRHSNPLGGDTDTILTIKDDANNARFNPNNEVTAIPQLVSNCMYVVSNNNTYFYDLKDPANNQWKSKHMLDASFVTAEPVFPASEVLVDLSRRKAITIPQPRANQVNGIGPQAIVPRDPPETRFRLSVYIRSANPKNKDGKLLESTELIEPSGVTGWQVVDGGIRYLTGDQKLHTLVVKK